MAETSPKKTNDIKDVRSDAIANRNILLFAAQKVFSEMGPEAQMSDIAKSAGVSRTTLYRHFPDKQSLITSLLDEAMNELELFASKLEPIGEAFFELLRHIAYIQVDIISLTKYLSQKNLMVNAQRVIEIFKTPVEQAKKANILNKDFDGITDVPLLTDMLSGALINGDTSSRKIHVEKALNILRKGLK